MRKSRKRRIKMKMRGRSRKVKRHFSREKKEEIQQSKEGGKTEEKITVRKKRREARARRNIE